MSAVAIRRVLTLAAAAPDDGARFIEDDFDRRHIGTPMGSVAVWVMSALLAPAPSVLASIALIDERSLNDASGRLRTGVGHPLVLQPPGGLSNYESRPNGTRPAWLQSTAANQLVPITLVPITLVPATRNAPNLTRAALLSCMQVAGQASEAAFSLRRSCPHGSPPKIENLCLITATCQPQPWTELGFAPLGSRPLGCIQRAANGTCESRRAPRHATALDW
ncbi:MAG: hypothetical protein ACI85K_001133 [Hyphomicrobiaceae bacterium]|jgi:hypothetical protein